MDEFELKEINEDNSINQDDEIIRASTSY